MRALVFAFVCAAIATPASAQQMPLGPNAPYDFAGIALGASLASVEALAPPEHDWRLVCHPDSYYGPQVQQCAYHDRAGAIARVRFDHTQRPSDTHIFSFAADRIDGTPRLFQIYLDAEADGQTREAIIAGFRHDIVAGISARFGAPEDDHAVANSAGFEPGNLDSHTHWQNAHGAIDVTGPNLSEWGLNRTIRVSYTDPDLSTRATELRWQWRSTQTPTP